MNLPPQPNSRNFQGIIPPHMLREIIRRGTESQQAWAIATLTVSERHRGHREMAVAWSLLAAGGGKQRAIFDARHAQRLPGRLVRREGDRAGKDPAVNEAYDASGAVYDFYQKVFGRNSIDGQGLPLNSTVHYGEKYDNAFWNGRQMVYGDGDGEIFQRFTRATDVIGHELTHGVTQFEAGFNYEDESGALNESFSDVMGSLVKQWLRKEKAADADWIIGKGLFTSKVHGDGLRSLKAPGLAYDDPVLGKDPQPAHMRNYDRTEDDNGGVHINSGIPNHAFYLAATAIGDYAWEKAGRIWYVALTNRLRRNSSFARAASATIAVASELFGERSRERCAVADAWRRVGIGTKDEGGGMKAKSGRQEWNR